MRRQTWRTPDVAATLRPMVRNAAGGGPPLPAWRCGTNFFKQNYPDHECPNWRDTFSGISNSHSEVNAMHNRHAAQTLAWSVLVTGVVAGVAGPAERSIFGAAVRRCGWVLRLRGGGTGNLLERRRVVHECAEEQELQVHADRGRRASRIA